MGLKKQYSEEELVAHLVSNNADRFGYIYDYFAPVLFGVIKKIIKNDVLAEDILQESFFKVWNSAASYDAKKARLYTWMLNITRNTAIDYLRSKQGKIEKKIGSVDDLVGVSVPHSNDEKGHNHIGLKKVVDTLKTEQFEIINLAFYEGYTQKEIAEKLQIPLGTVKTRCRSALLSLRNSLQEKI